MNIKNLVAIGLITIIAGSMNASRVPMISAPSETTPGDALSQLLNKQKDKLQELQATITDQQATIEDQQKQLNTCLAKVEALEYQASPEYQLEDREANRAIDQSGQDIKQAALEENEQSEQ